MPLAKGICGVYNTDVWYMCNVRYIRVMYMRCMYVCIMYTRMVLLSNDMLCIRGLYVLNRGYNMLQLF